MSLKNALFPPQHRHLPGRRWWMTALRTVHLVGIAGIGGAYLLGSAPPGWQTYLWLTLASGAAMAALEVWLNGICLVQLRGISVYAKLLLLGAIPLVPPAGAALFILVLVISGVVSHAPASLRHYSLLHGRRVDSPADLQKSAQRPR
ncbi:MAG TPA: hypothetical protein VFP70_04870 [Burkholderiales bacterium]|nr:hypothetical protein [Burkholderiales bacterium]